MDLASMVAYTAPAIVNGLPLDMGLTLGENTYIENQREELAIAAIKSKATHLLWLDDDMRFPPDTLMKLLAHDEAIVGVNYPTRRLPLRPTAFQTTGLKGGTPARLEDDPDAPLLVPVEALGFGAVLMRTEVFAALEQPWFTHQWDEKIRRWIGEDVQFCLRAADAGFEVLVDTELSREVGHTGMIDYELSLVRKTDGV